MGFLVKVFKWLFRALSIFSSVAPALWGVTVYGGMAFSLYVVVSQTANLISSWSAVFNQWANNLDQSVSTFFSYVSGNSFFQFCCYVFSLDVPIEWFRSTSSSFIRYWLTYTCGAILSVIEICIVVLGVMWVRSRLKTFSAGLDDSASTGI